MRINKYFEKDLLKTEERSICMKRQTQALLILGRENPL